MAPGGGKRLHPAVPRGIEICARRKPLVQFKNHHAMREGEDCPGQVRIAHDIDQCRSRPLFDPRRQQVTRQRSLRHEPLELRALPREAPVRAQAAGQWIC